MGKNYNEPVFEVVKLEESEKVFFAGSGGPLAQLISVSAQSLSKNIGSW